MLQLFFMGTKRSAHGKVKTRSEMNYNFKSACCARCFSCRQLATPLGIRRGSRFCIQIFRILYSHKNGFPTKDMSYREFVEKKGERVNSRPGTGGRTCCRRCWWCRVMRRSSNTPTSTYVRVRDGDLLMHAFAVTFRRARISCF